MRLSLKVKVTFILLAAWLIFAKVESAAAFSSFIGRINSDNINVRVNATVGSEIVCTFSKDESIEVISEAYDWYKIRLPKKAPSYVKKNLVECINTNTISSFPNCISAKVIKNRINIRLGPSESTWILGKADKLTIVNILAEDNGWYKIQPIYNSYGWVNKKFISKNLVPKVKEADPVKLVQIQKPSGQLIIEGKISPYGIVLWRKATHKLITPDNKTYFLKGNRKSLDRLNYQKVRVTGKLISPGKSRHPIIEINIIEVLN